VLLISKKRGRRDLPKIHAEPSRKKCDGPIRASLGLLEIIGMQ